MYRLDIDFDDGVCGSARHERLGWMECDTVNGLVVLFAMRGQLLHAALALQIPESHRAVVAGREEINTGRIDGQIGACVLMSY